MIMMKSPDIKAKGSAILLPPSHQNRPLHAKPMLASLNLSRLAIPPETLAVVQQVLPPLEHTWDTELSFRKLLRASLTLHFSPLRSVDQLLVRDSSHCQQRGDICRRSRILSACYC